jgi:hypothetical protein
MERVEFYRPPDDPLLHPRRRVKMARRPSSIDEVTDAELAKFIPAGVEIDLAFVRRRYRLRELDQRRFVLVPIEEQPTIRYRAAKRAWTESERETVRSNCGIRTARQIAELLEGRSLGAVKALIVREGW